jgi:iron complex outermembrane receptor protein
MPVLCLPHPLACLPSTTAASLLLLLATSVSLVAAAPATSPAPAAPVTMEAFTVTGTNIRRVDQENALPVSIFTADELAARDAATPMDQLAAIPFITDIPENETPTNGIAGRGDNANIALRGLGAGNTLVLLNGRRMPFHPFTAGAISPVNVNVLPSSVQQIEILRDGASSIYGSDAVAGVVNYIARRRPAGGDYSLRYGNTEHGGGADWQAKVGYARPFAQGRGSLMVGASAYQRQPIYLTQREISASADKTRFARPPFNVPGSSQDDRTPVGIWPRFTVGSSTANRYFYPINGVPTLTTTALPRDLYADYNRYSVGQPRTRRYSFNGRVDYDLTPQVRLFAEFVGYDSASMTSRQPVTLNASDRVVTLSPDNPYNPFGSRFYSPTGAPSADGTPRLTGAPQPLSIGDMLLSEGGPETIHTTNRMHRLLVGLQGRIGRSSWTWEAGAMTGGVRATDVPINDVRDSLLIAAAQRTDATAWNPFLYTFKVVNNAVVADQPYRNPASVWGAFTQPAPRYGHTRVDSLDFRLGGEAWRLWSGPAGVSLGAEWRRERKDDDKPPYIGLNPPGSGLDPNDNDILVMSPRLRFEASRTIASAYVETAVPLVAQGNRVPLVRSLELSASARFERYSDFGRTTKPKLGLTWRPGPRVLARVSINEGFLAPDLTRVYSPTTRALQSPPGTRDTVRNNYLISAGRPSDTQVLGATFSVANPNLQPEVSKGRSAGVVVEVPGVRGLSVSVDYWEIEQKSLIIAYGRDATLDDQLLRAYTQSQLAAGVPLEQIDVGYRLLPGDDSGKYKGDPNTLRARVTQADRDLFAAASTNLAATRRLAPLGAWIGDIQTFRNSTGRNFTNGFDFSLRYRTPNLPLGQLAATLDWAQFLNKFSKLTPTDPKSDSVHNLDLPRSKATLTLTWRKGAWNASVSTTWNSATATGSNASLTSYLNLGQPSYLRPIYNNGAMAYREVGDAQTLTNAGVGYRFGPQAPALVRRTSVRLGVNNVADQKPTLSEGQAGYRGNLGYSHWVGRAYSLTAGRDF